MSTLPLAISQCLSEGLAKISTSSQVAKIIIAGLKEQSSPSVPTIIDTKKIGRVIQGEVHIRPYKSSDFATVRDLFIDSNVGPDSFAALLARDQRTARISLFLYSLAVLGALLAFQPHRRTLGIALAFLGVLGSAVYLSIPYFVFKGHLKTALNGDMADIPKTFEVTETDDESELRGKNGFWVAECVGMNGEREVVGCVGMNANSPGATQIGSTTSELRRMVVSKDYRRRGIAQRLIKAVVEHAKERGVEQIYLTTSSYQDAAVKMYLKLGWAVKRHFNPTFLFEKVYIYELILDVNTCKL
ncbi:hypothetical protein D9613_003493 [Agrocybe pediades]|uniref:N-acetyltransferase domain-containing protein n=1 Tax=Agrocybe pediades TaxID=84607 RepID=A0A8H4VL45_9AGAR|nr:hypothetical protein D9613_003493 [Agrocybe pediades]